MMKYNPSANQTSGNLCRFLVPCMAIALAVHASWAGAALIIEAEPNNGFATASPLSPGNPYVSNIGVVGDIDWYTAPGAVAGHLVFAFADSQGSSASDDITLWTIDNALAVTDFDTGSGPGHSSVIAGRAVTVAGNQYLVTAESSGAAVITPYVLYYSMVDPADAIAEVEPNDSVGQAEFISGPMVTGTVSGIDVDVFAFEALAGQAIVVICDDDPDDDGVNTDTGLQIIDSDGVTILATGDNISSNEGNAAGTAMAAATGTYYLRIINGAAFDDDYRFVILVDGEPAQAPPPAPCAADADADGVCDNVDLCQGNNASGDTDGDGFCDDIDNCPTTPNPSQADMDYDGLGDSCDALGTALCGYGGLSFAPMMAAGLGLVRRRSKRMVRQ
ncbi:MAG: thrombospondin type 3 repeat-containing protein [Planctomycetes bacterium]|nr:thrombospondin type 3 repeat-containing protein [Planctomycetota bacterium]